MFFLQSLERSDLLFCQSGWNNLFNKRIIRSHPNVWNFIECLKKEVVFQQQALKLLGGSQKKKSNKALALQVRLNTLNTRFDNDEIDRQQYLEGLSLAVRSREEMSFLFIVCISVYFSQNTISCVLSTISMM